MSNLVAFLFSLCIAWAAGLLIGARSAGASGSSVPKWLPASYMANFLVHGVRPAQAALFFLLGTGLTVAGCWLQGAAAMALLAGGLFIFAPLAVCLCSRIRKDAEGGRRYVFFNELRPVGVSKPDEKRKLAFYIEDDEWAEIPAATPYDLKFWQQFYVTDGLYICPCEHAVLQAVDSLNLYRYLIHSDHPKLLHALANALHTLDPTRTSDSVHARRTFIELKTEAQATLAGVEPKDKDAEKPDEEDDDDDDDFSLDDDDFSLAKLLGSLKDDDDDDRPRPKKS